jgi:hypothetical protein
MRHRDCGCREREGRSTHEKGRENKRDEEVGIVVAETRSEGGYWGAGLIVKSNRSGTDSHLRCTGRVQG